MSGNAPAPAIASAAGAHRASRGQLALLAAHAAAVLVLAARAPSMVHDSSTYLEHSPFREMLVPLVYGGLRLLFHGAALRAAVALQTIGGALASAVLARAFCDAFSVESRWRWPVGWLLFFPQLLYAPTLSSESISYTLFAMAAAAALRCVGGHGGARAPIAACAWASAALCARQQFVVLLPFAVAGIAAVLAARRTPLPRRLAVAAACIAVLLAGRVAQRAYNHARTGAWAGMKTTGFQWLTVVVFNATRADVAALPTDEERAYAGAVLDRLEAEHLLASQLREGIPRTHAFNAAYNEICWHVLLGVYRDRYLPGTTREQLLAADVPPTAWNQFDAFTRRLAAHLLRHGWKRYLAHVAGSVWELFKFYAVAVGAMLLAGLASARRAPRARVLVFVAALWWANVLAVALVEYPMTRYTFYGDALVVAALALALVRAARPALGENG
jgi:hypothetical protein